MQQLNFSVSADNPFELRAAILELAKGFGVQMETGEITREMLMSVDMSLLLEVTTEKFAAQGFAVVVDAKPIVPDIQVKDWGPPLPPGAVVVRDPEPILNLPVADLELSVRSQNALKAAGVVDLASLSAMTRDQAAKIKNLGARSLKELESTLAHFGLSFAEPLPELKPGTSPEPENSQIEMLEEADESEQESETSDALDEKSDSPDAEPEAETDTPPAQDPGELKAATLQRIGVLWRVNATRKEMQAIRDKINEAHNTTYESWTAFPEDLFPEIAQEIDAYEQRQQAA